MSRRSLSMILTVAAGLLVGGGANAADAVRIGIAAPLSGSAATYGQDVKRGAELAAEEINAKGGILNGRKIELVYEDDKGSPQGGVAAVQKLMSIDRVNAITGGTNSSVVLAESSVTRNRILHVNAAAQADAITEQGSPWLFQINNTVSGNSEAFNSYIVNTLKIPNDTINSAVISATRAAPTRLPRVCAPHLACVSMPIMTPPIPRPQHPPRAVPRSIPPARPAEARSGS